MGKSLIVRDKTKRQIKNAITESLRKGSSVCEACEIAGISRATYYTWMQIDGNFRQSIAWAMKSRVGIVADALYKSACDGDVTAQKFFLTNRGADEWKEQKALINQGIIQQGDGAVASMPVVMNVIGVYPDAK